MLKTKIPRNFYNTTDYPNLESRAVDKGMVIPELWGKVENITPVCIDTTQGSLKYKIANASASRPLTSIDEVTIDGETVDPAWYTEDLNAGTITFDNIAPLLTAGSTYYLVLIADYDISDTNYMQISGVSPSKYSGTFYYIDEADAWSDQSKDGLFGIYGRKSVTDTEELLIDMRTWGYGDPTYTFERFYLRNHTDRTKMAQSFTMPAGDNYYITKITFRPKQYGSVTGNFKIQIHSDQAGTQIGGDSSKLDVSSVSTTGSYWREVTWDIAATEGKDVRVTATGQYDQIDDILDDALQNVIGIDSGDIDSTALANLGTARNQDLSIYLDSQITFQEFLEKLEAGQLFKFIPTLDGKYSITYYESGEPAGTPHLKDADFLSFRSWRDPESIIYKAQVKYYEDPTEQTFAVEEESSDGIANNIYKNYTTLTIETYLENSADALSLAADYISLFEYPRRMIEFTVSGYGFDLLPGEKVKITRARADNTDGQFDAVLFRILSIDKNIKEGKTKIKAVLDTQTY